MSKNICKNILYPVDVLLLAASLVEVTEWMSAALSILFLFVVCAFLSYVNRALYVFSSDRMTLPLLYLLTVLPYGGIFMASRCHLAALLILAALYFMLKFISEEKVWESLMFLSLLSISCAAAIVPPLMWLVIPFVFPVFSKVRNRKFPVFLMIIAALVIPSVYIFAYDYIFGTLDIQHSLTEWSTQVYGVEWKWEMSAVSLFFMVVTGIALLIIFFGALGRNNSERNTCRQREFRFISAFFLFSLAVALLFSTSVGEPLVLIAAMPWSFIFISYLDEASCRVGRRNIILLMAVSALVFRIADYI